MFTMRYYRKERKNYKKVHFFVIFFLFYFPTFSYALALYRNVETGISQASAATTPVIFPSFHFWYILIKSQSNFWLSFQKFLYAGIAYCYRLFRHFSLWKIFSNLLISPYVLVFKSSMWSSKFSVYYLCNQPLHFCYRRFGSRMRVIVQRHIDVGMSHDVLQCLWVHSCIC